MGRVPSPFAIAVGIGAGIASALGFAALVAGTSLAMPLFLFSALPVVIASLGWGTGAGIVALLTDFAVIAGFYAVEPAIAHALLSPLPAVVLSHLLGLARPADPANPDGPVVWFPLGTWLLAAVAVVGATTLITGWLADVGNVAQLEALSRVVLAGAEGGNVDPAQVQAMARLLLALMPVMSPAMWFLIIIANLWAGAHVVRQSERLVRPWEDLSAVVVPRHAVTALAILAVVVVGVGGVPGLLASPFFGALLALKLLLGLAVLHALSKGAPLRGLMLSLAWASLVLTVPALLILVLGIADAAFRIKGRRRQP
jgi:hypothetical protein